MVPARIGSPVHSYELIERFKGEDALKVVLWEQETARDLKGLLRTSSSVERFVGIVGPEGGFSQKEIDLAKATGFIPVSLGSRILRSETAAISIAAIVQYELGDLSLTAT
jgi:16S rRNA (uracil1498-N3)-methyltransferase